MKREIPESELPIDEQFEVLKDSLDYLHIEMVGRSYFEIDLDLVDSEMIVRRLDYAPPLRSQIVAELRRVAKLYKRLARRAELEGLKVDGVTEPKLLVAIHGPDGAFLHNAEIPDPREKFCEYFNASKADGTTAKPVS